MRLSFIILSVLFSYTAASLAKQNQVFVPEKDFVVALWKNNKNTPKESDKSIAQLLNRAKYMGNSDYYARAKNLLNEVNESRPNDPQLMYYNALIKQHYHEFASSLLLLQQILDAKPQHVNALLLSFIYQFNENK